MPRTNICRLPFHHGFATRRRCQGFNPGQGDRNRRLCAQWRFSALGAIGSGPAGDWNLDRPAAAQQPTMCLRGSEESAGLRPKACGPSWCASRGFSPALGLWAEGSDFFAPSPGDPSPPPRPVSERCRRSWSCRGALGTPRCRLCDCGGLHRNLDSAPRPLLWWSRRAGALLDRVPAESASTARRATTRFHPGAPAPGVRQGRRCPLGVLHACGAARRGLRSCSGIGPDFPASRSGPLESYRASGVARSGVSSNPASSHQFSYSTDALSKPSLGREATVELTRLARFRRPGWRLCLSARRRGGFGFPPPVGTSATDRTGNRSLHQGSRMWLANQPARRPGAGGQGWDLLRLGRGELIPILFDNRSGEAPSAAPRAAAGWLRAELRRHLWIGRHAARPARGPPSSQCGLRWRASSDCVDACRCLHYPRGATQGPVLLELGLRNLPPIAGSCLQVCP